MKPTDRNKVCPDCGVEFIAHYKTVRCKPCSKARTKAKEAQYSAAYNKKHKEQIAVRRREHWIKNREKLKPYRKKKYKEWYDKNREYALESRKEWRLQNLEKDRETKRQYLLTKRQDKDWVETERQRCNEYKKKNKAKERIRLKKWYQSKAKDEEFLEKQRQKSRRMYQKHKEKYLHRTANYKARKLKAVIPSTDKAKISKLYEKCHMIVKRTGEPHHVDHIIPLSKGGAHHQDNLRIITAKENIAKWAHYDPSLGGVWADNDLAKQTKQKLGIA